MVVFFTKRRMKFRDKFLSSSCQIWRMMNFFYMNCSVFFQVLWRRVWPATGYPEPPPQPLADWAVEPDQPRVQAQLRLPAKEAHAASPVWARRHSVPSVHVGRAPRTPHHRRAQGRGRVLFQARLRGAHTRSDAWLEWRVADYEGVAQEDPTRPSAEGTCHIQGLVLDCLFSHV